MIRRLFIAAALSVLMGSWAFAQRGGGGGGRMGGGGGGFPGGGSPAAPAVEKSEAIAKELKLTAPQRQEIEAIMDEAQKQTIPVMQQRDGLRKTLLDMNVGGQDTDAAVKKLAALDAQSLGIEVDAFTKTLAKLDSKQKSKAPKLFDMMKDMFRTGNWRKTT